MIIWYRNIILTYVHKNNILQKISISTYDTRFFLFTPYLFLYFVIVWFYLKFSYREKNQKTGRKNLDWNNINISQAIFYFGKKKYIFSSMVDRFLSGVISGFSITISSRYIYTKAGFCIISVLNLQTTFYRCKINEKLNKAHIYRFEFK